MHGITLYVGTTGTGKTHAALEDLRRQPQRKAILDLGGSALLRSIPVTGASRRGLPELARWTPESADELDAVLLRLYREGNCAILVDDMAALPSRELPKLCRLWRARNLRLLLTTQHVSGDIGQRIMACNPLIYAYKTTSPASLDWLEEWHGVEPEELSVLALGECLELAF